MTGLAKHNNIAVLIDAENAEKSKLKDSLDEIAAHGRITTRRAYGDWSKPQLGGWEDTINELAIQPKQQ